MNVNLTTGIINHDQLQNLIDAMPVDAGGQDGIVISGRVNGRVIYMNWALVP